MDMNEDHIEEYWQAFLATLEPSSRMQEKTYIAEAFGDNPELANYLGSLVRSGVKTATCSTLWEWEAEGIQIPEVGTITIVLDGSREPLCIIETIQVKILPYEEVDARFAYEEGEGDRSLEYWREAHWSYFSHTLAKIGKVPTSDMPLVCERFQLVYR